MYLELSHLYKNFEINKEEQLNVLNDINLSIEKSEFVSLLGPSGCGKSTLLYLIAGLESISEGSLTLDGKEITQPGPDRVVVFQSDGLFPWMTVLENVLYGLKIKKMPKEQALEKAITMLKMVHLGNYIDSHPHQLSGGMKQRVAIVRAIVLKADVILSDEPVAPYNKETRMVLQKGLLYIWHKTGFAIVFVSYNIREVFLVSEKSAMIATRISSI